MFTAMPSQLCLNPLFFTLITSQLSLLFLIPTGLPESLSVYFTGKYFIFPNLERRRRRRKRRRRRQIVSSVFFILFSLFLIPSTNTFFFHRLSSLSHLPSSLPPPSSIFSSLLLSTHDISDYSEYLSSPVFSFLNLLSISSFHSPPLFSSPSP